MRLFVAAYPPAEATAHLAAALPPLPAPWRPAPREQWHITLAFLGEVAPDVLPPLQERLARAADRTAPFALALAGGGILGGRILVAHVAGDVPALRRLAERVAAAARRAGVPVAERRYRAHLTLARSRTAAAGPDLARYVGPSWPVDRFLLVRSFLGPPLRHQPLAEQPLTG